MEPAPENMENIIETIINITNKKWNVLDLECIRSALYHSEAIHISNAFLSKGIF